MTRHICVIAGEPSGDFLGARLVGAVKSLEADCTFSGVGGPQMEAAGLHSLFPYEDLAVMGIAEVLPKLPVLMARIGQTVRHIVDTKPDVVVTIDSPDFCFRVAKAVKRTMASPPKIIHYVAPSVWAWREGRAKDISKFLDGLICLFDFEPPYFEKHGLKSIAAGHPLVEGGALEADGDAFREEAGIPKSETVVGMLFGSRRGEIRRIGPVLRDALSILNQRLTSLPHIVAPTLPHLRAGVIEILKDYPGQIHVITEPELKYGAFKSFDVAMAVSGTVGLELAALGVPHVIAYKMNPVTFQVLKRMVKTRYAHLANIMTGREIVPEFIQGHCQPGPIADRAFQLLIEPTGQRQEMAAIARKIGGGQPETPSEKAARFVLGLL